MNGFDVAAVLIAIAAGCGYLNHRLLRLPATSGTLIVALASSLVLIAVNEAIPSFGLARRVALFLSEIDFNEALPRRPTPVGWPPISCARWREARRSA